MRLLHFILFLQVCHLRIRTISKHLKNACSQLDDYIKLKRREDNKVLKSFLDMMKEINCIAENEEVTGVTKIGENLLVPVSILRPFKN